MLFNVIYSIERSDVRQYRLASWVDFLRLKKFRKRETFEIN